MSVLPNVLGWSASILGLFALYSLFATLFPSQPPCSYNIGCYLVPHSLNLTADLQYRLSAASYNYSQTKSIAHHYWSLVSNNRSFGGKALEVARSFEKYVQQLTEEMNVRQQDHEVILAIRSAQTQYQVCKDELNHRISSKECLGIWKAYLTCFDQVDDVRTKLNLLLKTEKNLQQQIGALIEEPKPNDPSSRPQFQAQKLYNQSMLANENSLRSLRVRLQQSEASLLSAREQKEKGQDRVLLKQHSYRECWQNRRIHRHCEEVSQQVMNISSSRLHPLEQQIQAKKRLMQEMREMMLRLGKDDNRKMPEHWNQMYKQHLEEYKQMLKDLIYNQKSDGKACGCNQQEEEKLLRELEQERTAIVHNEREIQRLTTLISSLRISLFEKEQEKAKIIADYQKALKDYETSKPEYRQSELIELKRELERNRKSILGLEQDYSTIDEKCRSIKRSLSAALPDINKAEECISKKEYLLQLRSQTAKYLPERSVAKLNEAKRTLVLALNSFQP